MRFFFSLTFLALLSASQVSAETPTQPPSQINSCADSATQTERLRIVKSGKTYDLQVRSKSAEEWHKVLSSIEKFELPRLSPNGEFLTYVASVRIRNQVAPWLYLQRLSNGWREVVSVLKVVPKELCFNSESTELSLVAPSGLVVKQDLVQTIKLLTRSGTKG